MKDAALDPNYCKVFETFAFNPETKTTTFKQTGRSIHREIVNYMVDELNAYKRWKDWKMDEKQVEEKLPGWHSMQKPI